MMTNDEMWNDENPVTDFEIDVPAWIDQDISPYDVASIYQGGCASGAYMPAVTYHEAAEIMNKHGDDVLQYIENNLCELPQPAKDESWSGMAVFYLSYAVEMWAMAAHDELERFEPDNDDKEVA